MTQNYKDYAKLCNQSTHQTTSRDSRSCLSVVPMHPYIDIDIASSACVPHSETVNQLYKLFLNNHGIHQHAANPFLIPIGSGPLFQAASLGNVGPLPFSSSKHPASSAEADALSLNSAFKNHQANNKGSQGLYSLEDLSKNREDRLKRTIDWEDRLQELIDFKKAHGHCMVPQSHPRLGAWVKWQREKYASYEEGKDNFSQEKIEILNKIGFVWRIRRKRKKGECRNELKGKVKTDSENPIISKKIKTN